MASKSYGFIRFFGAFGFKKLSFYKVFGSLGLKKLRFIGDFWASTATIAQLIEEPLRSSLLEFTPFRS